MSDQHKGLFALLIQSFRLYIKNFLTFLQIVLVFFVPLLALDRFIFTKIDLDDIQTSLLIDRPVYFLGVDMPAWLYLIFLLLFFAVAFTLLIIYYISVIKTADMLVRQEPFKIGDIFRQARVLYSPCMRVVGLVVVSVVLWSFLLIVPGIIFLVLYAFAFTACVVDQKQGKEALLFSRTIIQANIFRFISHIAVVAGIAIVLDGAVFSILERLFDVRADCEYTPKTLTGEILQDTFSVLWGVFPIIFIYLLYENLKQRINSTNS